MCWLRSVPHTGGRTDRASAAGCPQPPRPGAEAGGGREVARRRRKAGAARLEGLSPAPGMVPVSEQLEPQGAGGDPAATTPLPGPPAVEEPRRENGGEWCPGSGESGAQPRAEAEEVPRRPRCPESAAVPEPPEGGWGWVVMLASMWCNGAVFGIQNSCGVLFVSMLRLFGSSDDKPLVFKTGERRPGKGSGWLPARSASGLPRLQPGRRRGPAGGFRCRRRRSGRPCPSPGAAGARPFCRAGPEPAGALGNTPRGEERLPQPGCAPATLPPGGDIPGDRGRSCGSAGVLSLLPQLHL